uniref:Uncharacterized protein n=1 Tax=Chromera velia CCMP2878 TaxID=1169474 RepID=A0A0G4FS43_9ALVE|eukprot:Cvel_18314.t1-p1 / transcript=Cvel_18314.t1 / gene=Cvel_18314 / organism=Chromera_velia_CCMP2878 / gene_product=hypothetical protein / transcript_product=hypothetical protein / location=Cvel_scaffold1511:19639-24389(-) / protein_length=1133 / sequence_SO=supercontig / SO=protein_coding / is_pseudo=false
MESNKQEEYEDRNRLTTHLSLEQDSMLLMLYAVCICLLLECARGALFIQRGGLSSTLPVPAAQQVQNHGAQVAISADGSRVVVGSGVSTPLVFGVVEAYDFDSASSSWTRVGEAVVDDAATDAESQSLAISPDGTRIATGFVTNENQDNKVVVKELVGGTWTDFAILPTPPSFGQFGKSVSLTNNNFIAIGAPFQDGSTGAVYVYDMRLCGVGSGKNCVASPPGLSTVITGVQGNQGFGWSVSLVSISPTELWLAAGRPDQISGGPGAVEVYRGTPSNPAGLPGVWTQIGTPLVGSGGERCGTSVSLSGTLPVRLAYGCPARIGSSSTREGRVATWVWNEGAGRWDAVGGGELAVLGTANARLGQSVSLSVDGSQLAVGAPGSVNSGGVASGTAGIYEVSGSAWALAADFPMEGADARDSFGWAVALAGIGGAVVVGAYGERVIPGRAAVFDLVTGKSNPSVNADDARIFLLDQTIDQLQTEARLSAYEIVQIPPISGTEYVRIVTTAPNIPLGLSVTGSNPDAPPVVTQSYLTNSADKSRVRSFPPEQGFDPSRPAATPQTDFSSDEFFVLLDDWIASGDPVQGRPGSFRLTLVRSLSNGDPDNPVEYATCTWTLDLVLQDRLTPPSGPPCRGDIGVRLADARIFWEREVALFCPGFGHLTKEACSPSNPCDDGNVMVFGGLLCASGDERGCETVRNAQDEQGRWFRSPRQLNNGNTFSGSSAEGVLLYLSVSRDREAAQRWWSWIDANKIQGPGGPEDVTYRVCLEASSRCPLSDDLLSFFEFVWQVALGLEPPLGMRGKTATSLDPDVVRATRPGFRLNLIGMRALAYQLLGDSRPEVADALVSLESANPFFDFLKRGVTDTIGERVLDLCPQPDKPIGCRFQWAWERELEEAAWRESMGWDCIFMANILNAPFLPIPEGPRIAFRRASSNPEVFLRLDASRLTSFREGGGGLLNAQTPIGSRDFEVFVLESDIASGDSNVFFIASVGFPGRYLRVNDDGRLSPCGNGRDGCGWVNGQFGREGEDAENLRFRLREVGSNGILGPSLASSISLGTVAIEAVRFPNLFLRLNFAGCSPLGDEAGCGEVNLQEATNGGVSDLETFELVNIESQGTTTSRRLSRQAWIELQENA